MGAVTAASLAFSPVAATGDPGAPVVAVVEPATANTTSAAVIENGDLLVGEAGAYLLPGTVSRHYGYTMYADHVTGAVESVIVNSVTTGIGVTIGVAGGALDVGTFEAATKPWTDGHPALDVTTPGRSCGAASVGRFVVLERPESDTDRRVIRFAADYEYHCNGEAAAVFGSIRINSVVPYHGLRIDGVGYGPMPLNGAAQSQTIVASNQGSAPITFGTATIGGANPADFTITGSTCNGIVLVPFATCTVTVAFKPTALGARSVRLSLPSDLPLGPRSVTLTGTGAAPDVAVSYVPATASPATFYPVVDGYRDSVVVSGVVGEAVTIRFDIRNSSNVRVRLIELGVRGVDRALTNWSGSWNGKTTGGSLVPAGSYRITVRYTDAIGNAASQTIPVTVSRKKLYTYTVSTTVYGSLIAARGASGSGSVRTAASSYYRGIRLDSGGIGNYASVGYSFTLPSATVYSKLTYSVLGRSPNGRQAWMGIQNYKIGSTWSVRNFDVARRAGPAYAWYSTATTATAAHRSGRTVHGLVVVANEAATGGTSRPVAFDIAKVKLSYTYGILR